MPGMMDTILNLGLNDLRTQTLAEQTNADFAYNCYDVCYKCLLMWFMEFPRMSSMTSWAILKRMLGNRPRISHWNEHQALIEQY